MAAACAQMLSIYAPVKPTSRLYEYPVDPAPCNDNFYILDNADGSVDAAIEVNQVANPSMSRMDMFVTVTLPIILAALVLLGSAGVMYSRLDDAIDAQRLEVKSDLRDLSQQMTSNTQAVNGVQAEIGKMSGEIVKAKSEVISKLSELTSRQAILEAKTTN